MRLSKNFTLEEATFSSTASRLCIANVPGVVHLSTMIQSSDGMELVRVILENPIHIDSWFRCRELNTAVGGAWNSAHIDGWAIDFTCSAFGTPPEIVREIAGSGIAFDQVIAEGNWVHISFAPALRGNILTAHFTPGQKTTYTKGLA